MPRSRVCARLQRAILMALLGACACTLGSGGLPELGDLQQRAESWGDELRWGRFERAAGFVHPDDRPVFWQRVQGLEDRIRFTAFELQQVERSAKRGEAQVLASFSLYRLPSVEEETVLVQQRWVWDYPSGAWYVDPEVALAGLSEPATPPGTPAGR